MKVLSIEGVGSGGINSDVRPWTLPENVFTSGMNFKIYSTAVVSSGGSRSLATPPTNNIPGELINVNSPNGVYWLSMGRSDVLVYNGSAWDSIASWLPGASPLNDLDELNWSACLIGRVAFTNNPQHYPEYWAPQTVGIDLQPCPFSATQDWSEVNISVKVLRSHKNFLFAMNLEESIDGGSFTQYPDAYRWSHPADENGVPFSWDPTDASSLAGRAQLGGESGAIVDGKTLRNSFVIYSQGGINILDPDPEFVWKRRKLSFTHGLFNKDSLLEVKGVHYFLSDGDIVRNDGNTVESIMHNRLRSRLTANASTKYYNRSFALRNDTLKELWFCVPEDGSEWPNIAYIFNWRDQSWALRELPTELVHGTFGPTIISTQAAIINVLATTDQLLWSDWGGNWNEQTRRWSSGAIIPPDPDPPTGDFIWLIGNSGTQYGFATTYGGLDPSIIEGLDITEVLVDSVTKDVNLIATEQPLGSPTLTLLLETGEQVTLTYDDIDEVYEGNNTAFTDTVVVANGTSIGLNITVDDPAQVPPTTPLTASGDTLVGVRRGVGNLELLDPSTNDVPLNTVIERTDLPIEGHISVNTLTRAYPHITGTQDVLLTFGSQQFPGDSVNWVQPIVFNPSTDRKVDFRTTGPLQAWRLESINTGTWEFSGMDIEYTNNGVR